MTSDTRFAIRADFPEGYDSVRALDRAVRTSGLDHTLLELIKTRVSQLNGCAYCIDMHTKDARAAGETEQRLYGLSAWRETPFYSDAERAALALAEAVTLVASGDVDDDVVDEVRRHFGQDGLARIVYAIVAINSWNRLAISGRSPVGSYQPAADAVSPSRR